MVKGASITIPSGEVLRFGPDERFDIPTNVSWDTEMPGGFGPGQMTVPLPEGLHKDDQLLYADVRVYGPGNRTLAEGYITGAPRSGLGVTIQWAGHSTLLSRIENFRAIIVDRSLERWGDSSRSRRLTILGVFNSQSGPEVEPDTTNALPALTLTHPAAAVNPHAEAWYDAGAGNEIVAIYYDFTSLAGTSHEARIYLSDNDTYTSGIEVAGDLITTNNASGTGITSTGKGRFAFLRFWLAGTIGPKDQSITFRHLAMYGDHGIPLRGPAPQGVYASDVIDYIISHSPLTGTLGGSIEETTWIIPQLAWHEDVSLQQAVEDVTAFGGAQLARNDWGVYENREFFWRSPGTYGREWHVLREQIGDRNSDGPDADRRIAGVKVNYQDAAGETRSAGPPGSNSDYETEDLLDADPDNPAHRIPGMWLTIDAGTLPVDPTTGIPQAAINIGIVVINDRNRLFWRGTMTLTGTIEDQHGNPYPVAMVRAGDRIVIDDDPTPTVIPINSTSYTDDRESINLSLGARPDSEETMLTQLAAVSELIPG